MWKEFPQQLAEATGLDLFVYERRGYGRSSPITLPRPDDYLEEEGRDWLEPVLDAAGLKKTLFWWATAMVALSPLLAQLVCRSG